MGARAKLMLGLALLGLVGGALLQRQALSTSRAEHKQLQADQREMQRLTSENRQLDALRFAAAEVEQWREANRDLPGLRNQVRQLREQHQEMERLQAEIQRLGSLVQSGPAPPGAWTNEPGFLSRDTWADSGFATPESTVLTFFWANREQNIRRLLDCATPEVADQFAREMIDPATGQAKEDAAKWFNLFSRVNGIQIREGEAKPGNAVERIARMTAKEELRLGLKPFGAEWKIESIQPSQRTSAP